MKNRLTTLGILGNILTLQLLLIQAASGLQTLPPPPPSSLQPGLTTIKGSVKGAGDMATTSSFGSASPSYFSPADYGTNRLWVELTGITNQQAYFMLHNTTNLKYYEILGKTNLNDPAWIPLDAMAYPASVNGETFFPGVQLSSYGWGDGLYFWTAYGAPPNSMFFTACGGEATIGFYPGNNLALVRPSSTNAPNQSVTNNIVLFSYAISTPLIVPYLVFGSAVNGVDYSITGINYGNSTGTTTIRAGPYSSPPIIISTLYKTNTVFDNVSVSVAMGLGTNYVFHSQGFTVIISNAIPIAVVTNLPSPWAAGIDYSPVQNALLLSVNNPSGQPNNFVLVGTNASGALTITNWSGVAGAPNEVEIATVKTTTTNVFIEGDTFFGNGAVIDKLSADGSQWATDWCSLTNATGTDSSGIGGLRVDDSGTFGGKLIVATLGGGVWQIQSDINGNAHPNLLTNISTTQLAGVITLTNDVAKWGPWAGKILTGDPYKEIIYAINTNGIVTNYDTAFAGGIAIECFALIPANEDLYFIDALNGKLMKISRTALAPYVGDLMITQTATWGEAGYYGPPAKLVIVAWDSAHSVFKAHIIPASGILEDETFAPINLPSQ